MTLTEFIEARLAEDEAAAKAATGHLSGRWYADVEGNVQDENTGGGGSAYVGVGPWNCPMDEAHRSHITRHDPARVLREVAAMRKILAMHREAQGWSYPPGDGDEAVQEALTDAVSALAATWIDHPDYAEAVRP